MGVIQQPRLLHLGVVANTGVQCNFLKTITDTRTAVIKMEGTIDTGCTAERVVVKTPEKLIDTATR